MADPFRVRSAEIEDPRAIGREFVEDHTEYAKLSAHDHTVAWGSRGSGKTMHLRFLEPAAWMACHGGENAETKFRSFLDSGNGFIGAYINCREPALGRTEFRILDRTLGAASSTMVAFTDRYFGQVVLLTIATLFSDQIPFLGRNLLKTEALSASLRGVAPPEISVDDFLRIWKVGASSNLDRLRHLADSMVLGRQRSARDTEWLSKLPSLSSDVTGFLEILRQAIRSASPFFLMFDEANELSESFQSAVTALLSRRSQRDICIKIASQLLGVRFAGRSTQPIHDYVEIDLDALYTNNQDAYYHRVLQIANSRLRASGISADIKLYIPQNPRDAEQTARAREIASKRYDTLPPESRPESKGEYLKKYVPAIVFQEVVSPKANKSYAGFDNVVHLSSGIVRSFLDCCSNMYSRYVETYRSEPSVIPIKIQNDVIVAYSDSFVETLREKIDSLQAEAPERRLCLDLLHLLQGLGSLFRQRLMNKESREPRLISVSLKDDPDERLSEALKLAEQDAYLQKVSYRSKRGTRKLPCYVLNRRLCPHFNLDVLGFQGRIELSASELAVALDHPDQFASTVLARGRAADEDDLSQSKLWEW